MNHTTNSALAEDILSEGARERKPLVHITAKTKWWDLDLSEIRRRPGLLWLLVLKSIRVKYRQTILGVLWTVIQPLAPMLIFSFVFYGYFSKESGPLTYP